MNAPTKPLHPTTTLPVLPVKATILFPAGVDSVLVALGAALPYTPVLPTAEPSPVIVG